MIYTIDRIGLVVKAYGRRQPDYGSNLHSLFDKLDRQAGIDTRGGMVCCHTDYLPRHPVNPVGARLALHEAHLARPNDGRYYHWLGRDG